MKSLSETYFLISSTRKPGVVEVKYAESQCFGCRSMWIRIEMGPMDPDPYGECGFRIHFRDSQNNVQKEKIRNFKLKKSIDDFLRPNGFHLSLELLNRIFCIKLRLKIKIKIRTFFSSFILVMKNPGSESGSESYLKENEMFGKCPTHISKASTPWPHLEYVCGMRPAVVGAAELPEEPGLDGQPMQELQGKRLLPARLVRIKKFH